MMVAGVNFSLYYFLFRGDVKYFAKNEELRWYGILTIIGVVIFLGRFYLAPHLSIFTDDQLAAHPMTGADRLRTSLFHVVALMSNTGFQGQNFDYDTWGRLFIIPTVVLMIIGGCAGSTSGGIKVVRVLVLFKYIKKSIYELIHPSSVYNIKISDQPVEEMSVRRVVSFFSLFIILFMVNMVALTAMGMGLEEAGVSYLTCFSNYGPGTGVTGPSGTFGNIHVAAKWLLAFDMLVGRLEIFTILLLFTRSFWRAK